MVSVGGAFREHAPGRRICSSLACRRLIGCASQSGSRPRAYEPTYTNIRLAVLSCPSSRIRIAGRGVERSGVHLTLELRNPRDRPACLPTTAYDLTLQRRAVSIVLATARNPLKTGIATYSCLCMKVCTPSCCCCLYVYLWRRNPKANRISIIETSGTVDSTLTPPLVTCC